MADDSPTPENSPEAAPSLLEGLTRVWRCVNERKMVQWTIAYVALAYSLQHGVQLTSEAFKWEGVTGISMLLLALGLPVVMTIAWYHGERGRQHISGPELTIISILLVVGSIVFLNFVRPSGELAPGAAQQAGVTAARSAAASPKGAVSIAVLPFTNLSGDTAQEFFSDGMTEEITAALAKVPDLRVVARTSAYQFKDANRDMRDVGQMLGATHLIEGSVRKAGNRLRITAQLIKTDDGTHIWSENYDRELTDVFAIQEDIATAIAGALRMPLGLKQGERLISSRSIDPESYQQYLHAKALVRTRGIKPLTDAAVLLEQVVAQNPDYAPAWAQLSQAYGHAPAYHPAARFGPFEELRRFASIAIPKAEAAAQRAIQLDPMLAEGYSSLALVQMPRGKFAAGEELFSKALALDPNNPEALENYGYLLAGLGRLKESIATLQRLQNVEPFVPAYNQNIAVILWESGQSDAAIAATKQQRNGGAARNLVMMYAAAGHYREAADLLHANPGPNPPKMLAEAERLLRMAPAKAASPESLPRLDSLGFAYLPVGAYSRVLEWYESQLEAGYQVPFATSFMWHSSYAPVRKTERFKAFARKSGLVDYWRAKGWPPQCHPTTGDDFVCS